MAVGCESIESLEPAALANWVPDLKDLAEDLAAIPLLTLEAQLPGMALEAGGDALFRYFGLVLLDAAGSQAARFIHTTRADGPLIEEAIEAAYSRLAELEREPETAETSFRQRLFWCLLRNMQAELAARYAEEFDAARPLPRGAGYAALARARELLGQDPPPPAGDSSRG